MRHVASRPVWLALGLAVLAGAWLTPLDRLIAGGFSAHMTMHMAVVAVAAPLLAVGVAGGALDPVRKLPRLFAPIPASIAELIVVWGWHSPVLHHAARHSPWVMGLEQGSFLLSGLWVWLAVLGGATAERDARRATGVIALLLTSMHMTLLGALLALPPRPLYAHGAQGAAHAALADQHLGGAIMLAVGGLSYLAGGLWLAFELLRQRPPAARAASTASGGLLRASEEGDA